MMVSKAQRKLRGKRAYFVGQRTSVQAYLIAVLTDISSMQHFVEIIPGDPHKLTILLTLATVPISVCYQCCAELLEHVSCQQASSPFLLAYSLIYFLFVVNGNGNMHMLYGVTEFIINVFPQLIISNMQYLIILLLAIPNFDSSMNESRLRC
jgi:hypothetical protein